MPQIAQLSETFASQVFWMLIFFGIVFFVIGKGMVPKVMATVEARDKQIADDLAAAEAARKAADAQEEAWRVQANKQRAEAQALIAQAKADAAKAAEVRLSAAGARIDAHVTQAEGQIAQARQNALGEIETVASEAASDIVSRLAGITVDPSAARAAVKEALHG
ncbi:MAG: ATPase [Novosphingobium sp.]|jgi:F-type H+-transporting ATPase subunit b|nr:ATPase [Novosphingobium sp.]